jgi:hypothetical protein
MILFPTVTNVGCVQQLSDACTDMKVSLMFNNYATIFYALFTAIWGVLFLEMWKRRQATLACEWDAVSDTWAASLDQPRPEYVAAAREQRRNPITGEWEAYIPARTRYQRIIASVAFVSFLVVIVVAVLMGAHHRVCTQSARAQV